MGLPRHVEERMSGLVHIKAEKAFISNAKHLVKDLREEDFDDIEIGEYLISVLRENVLLN